LLQGQIDKAQTELGRLAKALNATDLSDLRAEVLAEAAFAAWRGGDPEGVLALTDEAEAVAMANTSLRARCREVRARVLTDRGQLEEAGRCWRQAGEDYAAAGDEPGQAMCSLGLGWVEATYGRLDSAQEYVEEAVEAFDRLGIATGSGVSRNLLGELARARQQLDLAEEHYLGARRRLRAAGALVEASTAALNLALVYLERGELNQARLRAEQASSELRLRGATQFQAAAHLLLATCAAAAEDWPSWDRRMEEAREELDRTEQVHADIASLAARAARTAAPLDSIRAAPAWELAIDQWARLDRPEEVAALVDERSAIGR
jgi:tetratricopeptide (TPR) repeat protein